MEILPLAGLIILLALGFYRLWTYRPFDAPCPDCRQSAIRCLKHR